MRASNLGFVLFFLGAAGPLLAEDWPAWRGATGLGISSEPEDSVPLRWSPTENVRWKVPLPDAGNSTPIVTGDKVFITQAVRGGKERATLCLDRKDGKLLWKRAIEYADEEPTHETNPYCSASPAAAAGRVVVSHGSAGIFCYDLEGKEVWRRDVGKLHHIWGNASSPVLHGGLCFLNCGPGDRTFLLALDAATGKEAWKVDIPGGLSEGESSTWTGSWATPILITAGGSSELIAGYPHRLLAFDPGTGKERWRSDGLGRLVYASPVVGDEIVVALSGYGGPGMAVRTGGSGDVTASHRLWRHERAPQRIGSGVVTGGRLYIVNEPGVAECIDLAKGESVWRERLGAPSWSSITLVGSRLYIPDQAGDVFVLRAAPRFELLARSSLDERTMASIAVSNGEIFVRTYKHLWCIAAPAPVGRDPDGR
jgi:outer membrane protein assembly factor BamB